MTTYFLCTLQISECHKKRRSNNTLQNRNMLMDKNNGYLISMYCTFIQIYVQNERLSTVDFIADKLEKILTPSSKITVIREVHSQETPVFKKIFPNGKVPSILL